jgi:hypothetical protein
MQINISQTHQSSGLTKVCDFAIESNAVMIRALTSRLYSKPVHSIVRELASNALDACPTKPMEIGMPTPLSPKFVIRDHGPGLSPDAMVTIFTRFGNSTKRQDNSQIGGFGLGAKSPFAIVNSFTIRSFHAGTCTTYIASIGNEGMPGLHVVSTQPTNETGLEISVPASGSEWADALSQIQFFQPKPIVKGAALPEVDVLFDHPKFMLTRNGKPFVLVGPVAYPLNDSSFGNLYSSSGIAFKFDIGEIEVTASREEVVYTPVLRDLISERLNEARRIYAEHLDAKFRNADSALNILADLNALWYRADYMYKDYSISNQDGISLYLDDKSFDGTCYGFDRYARRRKVWQKERHRATHPGVTLIDTCFVIDTPDWLRRIQMANANFPSGQGRLIVADNSRTFDLLGIGYIKTSTLPAPKTATRVLKNLRTLDGNSFHVTTKSLPYYLHVTENHVIIGNTRYRLTVDLYKDIKTRTGQDFYVATGASLKTAQDAGATDILPELEEAVKRWLSLHNDTLNRIENYAGDISCELSLTCRAALHKAQLLPPEPRAILVPPLVRCFPEHINSKPFDWKTLRIELFKKYPMLKCIQHSRHDCTDIVNLIINQ